MFRLACCVAIALSVLLVPGTSRAEMLTTVDNALTIVESYSRLADGNYRYDYIITNNADESQGPFVFQPFPQPNPKGLPGIWLIGHTSGATTLVAFQVNDLPPLELHPPVPRGQSGTVSLISAGAPALVPYYYRVITDGHDYHIWSGGRQPIIGPSPGPAAFGPPEAPEPGSWLLLGTGSLTLSGSRLLRR
jgi:hypothetical protein